MSDEEKDDLKTTGEELSSLIEMFTRDQGRPPGLADIMMMREAIASVKLDHDDEVGTYEVVGTGGAYTAHHPKPVEEPEPTALQDDPWLMDRIARALDAVRTADLEGLETELDMIAFAEDVIEHYTKGD